MHHQFCTIRRATPDDLDAIDELLRQTADEVNDRNVFVADDREYIARHIGGADDRAEGFILVATNAGAIAGFLAVDFPGDAEYHLGNDLGWNAGRRKRAAHMDIACVHPSYRGYGLQKRLLSESERVLAAMGYAYALATVYPENMPSLTSLRAAGYEIGATKPKYGGVLRHIMWKCIAE